jgi:hypothetical protein
MALLKAASAESTISLLLLRSDVSTISRECKGGGIKSSGNATFVENPTPWFASVFFWDLSGSRRQLGDLSPLRVVLWNCQEPYLKFGYLCQGDDWKAKSIT